MKRIAVLGAGIFGCTAALELSKHFDVTIFDRAEDILTGATTHNHLRHHYGYHYPRSEKTVEEAGRGRASFEKEYGECVVPVDSYFAISKTDSLTTPEQFLAFCDKMKLPYTQEFPPEGYIDRSRVALCVKTPEPVYDPDILRRLVLDKLQKSKVKLLLGHEIIGAKVEGTRKLLSIRHKDEIKEDSFDIVVNATYSNFNRFNTWFGLPRKTVLYEVVELLELAAPLKKIGLTVLDGKFSSILPKGNQDTFTLGHVKASIHKAEVSDDLDPQTLIKGIVSNHKEILAKGAEDFPVLSNARYIKSIFITRVVKANVDATDERLTDITEHGNGLYSIFAGKVVTCVDNANTLAEQIRELSG